MVKTNPQVLVLALVLAFTAQMSFQCSPGPDYKPLTVEQRFRLAPIVVRGYLLRRIGSRNRYRACLYVSHAYKGHGQVKSNVICADKFGSTAACMSNLSYGVEYLLFLNKKGNSFRARYDVVHGAAARVDRKALVGVRKGLCCQKNARLCFLRRRVVCQKRCAAPLQCKCQRPFKG